MPVTVLNHHFEHADQVTANRIMDTIEKNRDRVRITANMLVTLSGILISFCSAFVLFLTKEKLLGVLPILIFVLAAGTFLSSAILGISSTYLRVAYAVLDEPQFINDLLHRYNAEMRLLRLATATMIVGLVSVVAGATSFAIAVGG